MKISFAALRQPFFTSISGHITQKIMNHLQGLIPMARTRLSSVIRGINLPRASCGYGSIRTCNNMLVYSNAVLHQGPKLCSFSRAPPTFLASDRTRQLHDFSEDPKSNENFSENILSVKIGESALVSEHLVLLMMFLVFLLIQNQETSAEEVRHIFLLPRNTILL